ncbi:MAG TPA: hypothetical protein VGQ51_01225 [Puia sp.]|jgi:hypothetical protein|nr:hypothetical protein [Puia sp.]
MSADEFQQLWKSYEEKLQKSMKLNLALMEANLNRKARVAFNWQIAFKIMMIGLGLAWNIFVGGLMWRYRTEPAFVVAALMVLSCTGYAIGGYFLQVLVMLRVNLSDSIVATQKQLAMLEVLMVRTLRVPFLQTPAYFFFFVTRHMMATSGPWFWLIEGLLVAVSIVVTIWVYRSITLENAARKGWVRRIVDNEGWKAVKRAREYAREIEEFREE